MDKSLSAEFELAKKKYASFDIDVDEALEKLSKVRLSLHCWQGDDVTGFFNKGNLTGGIQVTGNYPYKATNVSELRNDILEVLTLLPGKNYSLNLHAIYLDSDEKVELDQIEPRHFASWVEFAKKNHLGLDFNPTCFSHPMASRGFTLSSQDEKTREFWVRHCIASRKIAEYFGKELGIPSLINYWIPDGMKDTPIDRLAPRERLKKSLDEILASKVNKKYVIDAVESKLFGIGLESYTVGSNEFYLGYAVKNQIAVTLDSGHFHPTEMVSDKISSTLLFVPHLLLHVSRPVRWDSDHVVILDDELVEIARSLVRNNLIDKTSIALDFFDGSINRIAAWTIGARSTLKAILKAYLEPTAALKKMEKEYDYTDRLLLSEELKELPFGTVFDYYCAKNGVKYGNDYVSAIHAYEKKISGERK